MSTVVIHKNVVLHGITLAENAEIKNMYIEQLPEDPIIDQPEQQIPVDTQNNQE